MKNPKFSFCFRTQKIKPNSLKSFKIVNFTLLILITSFILFSGTSISTEIPSIRPPEQLEPKVTIELDVTEEKINTSAGIIEPIAHVEGKVKLESNLLIQISVNLTISSLWNSSVSPHLFNLTVTATAQGHVSQDIVVTVKAPMGTEDETNQVVTISGTYSYLSDITSQILVETISPVQLTMIAENITADQNGDNGNGNGKDDDNGSPGFDGILLIASVMVIIFFIYFKKKRY